MIMGHMDCIDARPLVPSYLDGELSEAQAGPLRRHLLACQVCRASAQTGKNLKRWFAATQPVAVPRDFAARVARMAFAGVEVPDEMPLRDLEIASQPVVAAAREPVAEPGEGRILTFVLRLTVAAAVLALLASVAIQSLRRPSSAELRADDRRTMTLEQALERLDRIERAEQAGTTANEGR
jgi:anti-sigma factor RsiW